MRTPRGPTIFISYSQKDGRWKDRLREHLAFLEETSELLLWDDTQISEGSDWYQELSSAMERAAIAICLVSENYLKSDFCTREELPYLLERREKAGMRLFPVLLQDCEWHSEDWIRSTQMFPRDGTTIEAESDAEEDRRLRALAALIRNAVEDPDFNLPVPLPRWPRPGKIAIDRLPRTGHELFGRRAELELLSHVWSHGTARVVSLVGQGGIGKSTLVNRWLKRMEEKDYLGATKVFGWSFYSQGTGERVTSADEFMAVALEWFGDKSPGSGSPWDKGERLARLVGEERTLLILDGMEPLQDASEVEEGSVKDPALGSFLRTLARQRNALCVITTRLPIPELAQISETVISKDLEHISSDAAEALLRVRGVRGSSGELRSAASEFGNHALAVRLLAAFIHEIPGHSIEHAGLIPDLEILEEAGRHPRRVLKAFEIRLQDRHELQLLRVLGLFDRPADSQALGALLSAPSIPSLTCKLKALPDSRFGELVERLRDLGLVAPRTTHEPRNLDTHPIVREHFAHSLRTRYRDAWRAGHNALSRHYEDSAKLYPETLQEMTPLFLAMTHGAFACRFREILDGVYWKRIHRGPKHFSWNELGAFGEDLAALAGLFAQRWDQPVEQLPPDDRAFLLNEIAIDLRALGRLESAIEPMQRAAAYYRKAESWDCAARVACNLYVLDVTAGNLVRAQENAELAARYADASRVPSERIASRLAIADALHQRGRIPEASKVFAAAEELSRNHNVLLYDVASQSTEQVYLPAFRKPTRSLRLYSYVGYQYLDFLLSTGDYDEVLHLVPRLEEDMGGTVGLLPRALNRLCFGLAAAATASVRNGMVSREASANVERALGDLRKAGAQHLLPRGLVAQGYLRRRQGDPTGATNSLQEALEIATRARTLPDQADVHREMARLSLEIGELDSARRHLEYSSRLVSQIGYQRREPEQLLVSALLALAENDRPAAENHLEGAKRLAALRGQHGLSPEIQEVERRCLQSS